MCGECDPDRHRAVYEAIELCVVFDAIRCAAYCHIQLRKYDRGRLGLSGDATRENRLRIELAPLPWK